MRKFPGGVGMCGAGGNPNMTHGENHCGTPITGRARTAILARLPRLDPATERMQSAARILACCGVEASVEWCHGGRHEIRVAVEIDGVSVEAGIGLAEWCASQLDGGERLAFDQIDPAYLLAMVEHDANATLLRSGTARLGAWRALGVRRMAGPAPCLRVRVGEHDLSMSLQSWPMAAQVWFSPCVPWHVAFDGVALPVSLRVGRSPLTRELIRRMRCGDVLLIRHRDWKVQAGPICLGTFSISGLRWKMETFDDLQQAHDAHVVEYDAGEPSVDPAKLDQIPIEAEFVLASQTLTLAELRTMEVGSTFPLEQHPFSQVSGASQGECLDGAHTQAGVPGERPPDPVMHAYPVKVRINGQTVAQAELVALGDQLAVQIVGLAFMV